MSDESAFSLQSPAEDRDDGERREWHRKVIRVQARIIPDGDEPLAVQTVDLSLAGVGITSGTPLNLLQECVVELGVSVPWLAQPPSLRAIVRYCAQLEGGRYRIGMKFSAVSIEAAELLAAVLA